MTSKISFFKLCLENMKRRIWLLVITILTYFISMPLAMMISIQNEQSYIEKYQNYVEIFSTYMGMGVQSILAAGFGILCAIAGFAWLFSKKKVDMYHSMPIRREKLFAAGYLNGILIWLVPYLISVLICLIMIGGHLHITGQMFSIVMLTLGVNILFFLFFYNLALVAVMLTGNMINCLVTGGVLFAYALALRGLLELYLQYFIATYYSDFNILEDLKFTSPLMSFIYFAETYTKWKDGLMVYLTGGAFALYLLQCLVLAVIAGTIALILYKKRPSEAAGKSIAFVKILNIYRILLVIPLALGSGIFFAALVDGTSEKVMTAWLIFGLLFGLILSHGFIEVLFQMDIRAMFSYKKQLAATGVVVFLVAFSFKGDWYGMDQYLPEKEKLESMAITAGAPGNWSISFENYETGKYTSLSEYILEHMTLTDTEAAYELARRGMEYVNEQSKIENDELIYYIVKYRMDGGKEVIRRYWLPAKEAYPYVEQLYSMEEYKTGSMMGMIWEYAAEVIELTVSDTFYRSQNLDSRWITEFLEVYLREYESLTADEIVKSSKVGEFSCYSPKKGNIYDVPVYSSCEETIQFLQEHGIDTTGMKDSFMLEEVKWISVRVGDVENSDIFEKYGVDGYGDVGLFIKDEQEMAKLLPYLVRDQEPYSAFKDYDHDYEVYVGWERGGESYSVDVQLRKGSPIEELEIEVESR